MLREVFSEGGLFRSSIVIMVRAAAFTALGSLAAACGGGGSSGPNPAATTAPIVGTSIMTHGNAVLTIPNRIPAPASSNRRVPKFVSPSTVSVAISVNGGAPAYSDVSVNSPLCTAGSNGRVCTVPFTAPVGSDTVSVKLYDAAAGAGTLLGTGTATATAAAGATFSVTVPVSPIAAYVSNISVSWSGTNYLVAGTRNSLTLSFTFLDPDGNTIVASTSPSLSSPLTITSNDAHVTVTPTTLTSPSQTVTATYDGSPALGQLVIIGVDAGTRELGNLSTAPEFNYLVSTLAGTGQPGAGDGPGTSATFNGPYGLAVDTTGNVYVADTGNEKIRKITPAGVVSTFAGSGGTGAADGPAGTATFSTPFGVAVSSSGIVYVADNANNKIRMITQAGVVSTFAGTGAVGSTDGPAASATFNGPRGIITDASGNVYVSDIGNSNGYKIRMITAAGVVSTIAGTGAQGSANGPAAGASFYGPSSVTLDSSGNLYIADTENNLIREISGGIVSTFAGTGASTPVMNGPGASATFFHPDGTAIDNTGDILVADASNNLIRLITSSGYVSTVAGSGASAETNGTGTAAAFNGPIGVAIDGSGNIYVADVQGNTIRKIVP